MTEVVEPRGGGGGGEGEEEEEDIYTSCTFRKIKRYHSPLYQRPSNGIKVYCPSGTKYVFI